MNIELDDFTDSDSDAVNRVALAAFEQYREQYRDWDGFRRRVANMSSLAASGEVIVARTGGRVIGAVAYVGPGMPKAEFFRQEWPILRLLVVEPVARGRGAGRSLAEECVRRAVRDDAPLIALHTSPIMAAALALYHAMGFSYESEIAPVHGVPYGLYIKRLGAGV